MENPSTERSKRGLSNSPSHHHQLKKSKIETLDNDESENPIFPEEIIIEILVRLPVKTLIKFRCVSKSWLILISTPQFIKTHLDISSKEQSFSKLRVMVSVYDDCFNVKLCSALSLICEPVTDVFDLVYPREITNQIVRRLGFCNGLVCFATGEKDLTLWNPSTRMYHKLPPVNVEMKPRFCRMYGFGYDESSDDYKVVGFFYHIRLEGVSQSVVKVYSLRTNSWKRIGDCKAGIPLYDYGTPKFLDGKIHFVTTPCISLSSRRDIVSLDLKSEVYGRVEQPNYREGVTNTSWAVLGGCLSVLCDYSRNYADLWVLKEYGVKESWTKLVTIPYTNNPEESIYSNPLWILPNGEILLVFGSDFVVYNTKDNSLRCSETSNLGEFLDADIFIESLILPTPNAG